MWNMGLHLQCTNLRTQLTGFSNKKQHVAKTGLLERKLLSTAGTAQCGVALETAQVQASVLHSV